MFRDLIPLLADRFHLVLFAGAIGVLFAGAIGEVVAN
jgi:hypothetical protein